MFAGALDIDRAGIGPSPATSSWWPAPPRPSRDETEPDAVLPEHGSAPEVVYRRVHDELLLDDPAGSNLGSFVQPRMDPWAEQLVLENLGKNLVCSSEYRRSKHIHDRLVEALADLYHAPPGAPRAGTATAGSSEAILLALLAHKMAWREARLSRGEDTSRPNVVVYADAHVCWDKFGRFFDVEIRKVPIRRAGPRYEYCLSDLEARIDENTICVGAVVGTTYTGARHPVAEIDALLGRIEAERGWDIPIHVDAATGGFLLPFMEEGRHIAWDFRLPRVRTINVSGHKYGLVFPGLGWLLFREASALPRDLVFDAPYLGGPLDTFTLNFSRSAAPIVAQYYTFVRHGRAGFRAIVDRCGALARELAARIAATPQLDVVSDLELPIVCFRTAPGLDPFELSARLRARGFVVPAYAMPEGAAEDVVLRVVVHERFEADMVRDLARAITETVAEMVHASAGPPDSAPRSRLRRTTLSTRMDFMRPIRDLEDASAFFEEQRAPIFYVCTVPHNLLPVARRLAPLRFLAAGDYLDGHLPHACAPRDLDPGGQGFEDVNVRLLEHPEVRRFIAAEGPGGKALFLMFDEAGAAAAEELGLEVCLPSPALRRSLDDKLTTTRMAEEVGIRSVPHVLARVDGYAGLRRVAAHLGLDLVIQLPHGDSGQTTFFIGSEADYAPHAAAIEGAREVKIMKRIRCRPAAIEACVTGRGVVVGPLASELCGFPALTPYRGGWCGNEIGHGIFSTGVIEAARDMTRRFGQRLWGAGYRGIFGLDFLLDEGSGELYLGELNPRITGLSPLTTQVALDLGTIPILLLHLIERAGAADRVDHEAVEDRLSQLSASRGWSQLIVKQTTETRLPVGAEPPSGVYRLHEGPRGSARFLRPAWEPGALASEDEALIVRTVNRGWARPRGTCLSRLVTQGRVLTPEGRLSPRAGAFLDAVRAGFRD